MRMVYWRRRAAPGVHARPRARRARRARHASRQSPASRFLVSWPLASGLTAVLVLSCVALLGGNHWLEGAEENRLTARTSLIRNIAGWESDVNDPARLRTAVDQTDFDRDNTALDTQLLARFQLTAASDATQVVALIDRSEEPLAIRPTQETLQVRDLGPAWAAAWNGDNAVSPAFRLGDRVVRATVVPVGGQTPWAVLVSVSTEQSNQQLGTAIGALVRLRDGGSLSTVDPNGVAVISTDGTAVGKQIIDRSELYRTVRSAGQPRVWSTGGDDGLTHIAATQPTTGYTTYLVQPTDQLYGALRAQRSHRNLTLLAVTMVAVLAIAVVGLRDENRTRRRRDDLRSILAATRDIVMTVSVGGRLEYISPAVQSLLGRQPATLRGRPLAGLVHAADIRRVTALLTEQSPAPVMNVRLLSGGGGERWFDISAWRLSDRTDPCQVILTCHPIERRKELLDELGFQAGHDPLTGLANRATFDERLAAALGERSPTDAVSLLFIDLDHFKPINDTYGHAAGDQVLAVVAERLAAALSAAQSVTALPGRATASRFGGDEFGVLLPGADGETAGRVAERLGRALREPIGLGSAQVAVGASIGVAVTRTPCRPTHLLRAADEAMYRAKAGGRGRYAISVVEAAAPAPDDPGAPSDPSAPASGATPRSGPVPGPVAGGPGAGVPPGHPLTRGGPAGNTPRPPGGWRRLTEVIPSATAVVVLVGILVSSLVLEAAARDRTQKERLEAGTDLVGHLTKYAHDLSDPGRLTGAVSDFPWEIDDRASLTASLRAMASAPIGGPSSLLAIVNPIGELLAVEPPGAQVPIGPLDPFWSISSHGGALTPLLRVGGHRQICTVVPILRGGVTRAQLMMCPTGVLPAAQMLRTTDGLSSDVGEGGVSVLDQNGQAILSWDESLLGQVLVDPAELRRIGPDSPLRVRSRGGPGTIAVAASIPNGGYVLLDQTADLVEVSTLEHRPMRDGFLFGIIGVTVLGLAVANRRRERAIRQDFEQLEILLHGAHDIVVLLGRDRRLTFVSSAVDRLLGRDRRSMIGHDLLRYVHPEDQRAVAAFLDRPGSGLQTQALTSGGSDGGSGAMAAPPDASLIQDVRLKAHDGIYRWFDIEAAIWEATDAAGRPRVPVLTCREIGARRGLTEQARRRARHDPLTGLPNRAALAEYLETIARDQDAFAILLVDLDAFKPVNDRFGHAAGDHVLRVTADRIQRVIAADQDTALAGAAGGLSLGAAPGGGPDAVPGDGPAGVGATTDADAATGGWSGEERRRLHRPSSWLRRNASGSWYRPERGAVFRIGGDEFVAVLTGPSTTLTGGLDVETVAWHAADQITAVVREPIIADGHLVSIGATVGVALSRGLADPQAVIGLADAAMYESKRASGGGRPTTNPPAPPPRAPGQARPSAAPAPAPAPAPLPAAARQRPTTDSDTRSPHTGAEHVW
ncbi:diguanylate cyclase domain-containing protein [Parafrankia elaeagni]|uniref:diguanylate cyclase domain-containing protein n=1 Tax=Parafrankia elaeagni TaxID=222534 RepID=UPI000A034C60|nr:diguanylate cyclase [Parafrankia elaeagni]